MRRHSVSNDLLNDEEISRKHHETINWAFRSVLGVPYFGTPEGNENFLEDMPETVLETRKRDVGMGAG